ncbi:MAG TPA: hypothetical protein VLE44_02105 [Candidatus Saccharimonadales bacterium]|nr:hypothetical protein [Candidatus Saccharimonadales bacterium]
MERSIYQPQTVEKKKIEAQIIRSESGKNFDLIPVANSGYILLEKRFDPQSKDKWIMFDFDDTMIRYTEGWKERNNLYFRYLTERRSVAIRPEQFNRLMKITHDFPGKILDTNNPRLYRPNIHMSVLTWVSNTLANSTRTPINESLEKIETVLKKIEIQANMNGQHDENDPFYFDKNLRFVLSSYFGKSPWNKDIENIFRNTMLNPKIYDQIVQTIMHLGNLPGIGVGIFTMADPNVQIGRILGVLQEHLSDKQNRTPIKQIWISKVPKGEFIRSILKDHPNIFSLTQKQIFVQFDDSIEQLENIQGANLDLTQSTRAIFLTARAKIPSTFNFTKVWSDKNLVGRIEIDLSVSLLTDDDIVNALLTHHE